MDSTLADKAIPQSISNRQTNRNQVQDREASLVSQPTILQKINVVPSEKSQPGTKRQNYALVEASKLTKILEQP